MSRQQSADALQHIYTVVLGLQPTAPLIQGLNAFGVVTTHDLLTMYKNDIDTLSYDETATDGTVTRRMVPKGHCNLVSILKHYKQYRTHTGNPINDAWTTITQEEFDTFRISDEYMDALQNDGSVNFVNPGQNAQPSVAQSVPPATPKATVSTWDKGVKRDPTYFPILKDEKFHDTWHRNMRSQARAQLVY